MIVYPMRRLEDGGRIMVDSDREITIYDDNGDHVYSFSLEEAKQVGKLFTELVEILEKENISTETE